MGTLGGLTDSGSWLEWYTGRSGEAAELAFAALVERHGSMVLRVCRAILHDEHDAHDAFQATFLVLVRRAGTLWTRDSLGPWLHQVAYRVAIGARSAAARRRRHETKVAERTPRSACDQGRDDFGPALHEELGRLPERYRSVLVLCHLEGLTHQQAARHLGWPLGTVQSRLARGRERLRRGLVRRGLAPSVAVLGATFAAQRAPAAVPAALSEATVRIVGVLAGGTGRITTAGTVPAAVAELVEGVLRSMVLMHWKRSAAVLLALAVVAAGAGVRARQPAQEAPAALPRERTKVLMPSYVVEPPDMIIVEVLQALQGRPISGERLVRPDGTISLSFYGEVHVAGLTTGAIKERVISHLRTYLSDEKLGLAVPDPDQPGRTRKVAPADSTSVFVDVTTYDSKNYHVLGDVASPGRFPITGNDTVLDAITYAGGLNPTAAASNVRLVRPPGPGSDHPRILRVDYTAIATEGDPATNYQLFPGDRLIVTRDPKADVPRDEPKPVPAGADLRGMERRLEGLEQKLDRLIELLGAARTVPPAPAAPGAEPTRKKRRLTRWTRLRLGGRSRSEVTAARRVDCRASRALHAVSPR